MTKIEIIKETYDFYTADPNGRRAIENGMCKYINAAGAKCAVGRCMNEHANFKQMGNIISYCHEELYKKGSFNLDDDLLPRYHGHSINFWKDLQKFHDNGSHWIAYKNTISEDGEAYYQELLTKYADGEAPVIT